MGLPGDIRSSRARRHRPSDVPVTLVDDTAGLSRMATAVDKATNLAVDTETLMIPEGIGPMRVLSCAVRVPSGDEEAFVVDARDLDPARLAPVLSGMTADAWNADFDARVTDSAIFEPAERDGHGVAPLRWWDGQLADAVLHQGMSGFTWYHGLAWATKRYLGLTASGKGTVQLSYNLTDDLNPDQVAYAAADAVETLWVCDELRDELHRADLTTVAELEMAARPFLDAMERHGLPFDWLGWQKHLAQLELSRTETLDLLARLTGGGQGSLFSATIEPSWNPGSEAQVKGILNRFEPERVRRWTAATTGSPRALAVTDSVRHDSLIEIGGDIAQTVLEYRDQTKVLSTYGEGLRDHVDADGRMHPQYLQVVGTNTGRLASRRPNAQNFTPRMKPYFRPHEPRRVFVYADLSQAELRVLAQITGDDAMRAAFVAGEDIHVATAARMFGENMTELRTTDPERYGVLRAKAKRINFGIVYGQRARALGRSLTLSGVETDSTEAQGLLDAYLAAYPGVAAWLTTRDDTIAALRACPGDIDWVATMRIRSRFPEIASIRSEFRATRNRWPEADEIVELLAGHDRSDADTPLLDLVTEVLAYQEAVVLDPDGTPFTFCSFTPLGRRQQFNMRTDRVLAAAALTVCRSSDAALVQARSTVENRARVGLSRQGRSLPADALKKILEDRRLRFDLLDEVAKSADLSTQHRLLDEAFRDQLGSWSNAYRNAPIQGAVADIMLVAYAELAEVLARFPDAVPVQTVHDSVAVECREEDSVDIARQVKDVLERAMTTACPNIPAIADADVRTSLSDSDVTVHI